MTEQELQEFKARVQYAIFHGFKIGKASEYAEELAEEGGSMSPPSGVKALSAAHLLLMVEQVEQARGGGKPAPKATKPKAEAKPAKEPTKAEAKADTKAKAEIKADVKADAQMRSESVTVPVVLPEPPDHHDSSDFTSVLEDLSKEVTKK